MKLTDLSSITTERNREDTKEIEPGEDMRESTQTMFDGGQAESGIGNQENTSTLQDSMFLCLTMNTYCNNVGIKEPAMNSSPFPSHFLPYSMPSSC